MMKKMFLLLVAMLFAMSFISACGDDGDKKDKTDTDDTDTTDTSAPDGDTDTDSDTDTDTDSDTDTDTDSDTDADAQLSGNPCADDNPWICNPVTNEGCEGTAVCAWGTSANFYGFFCYDGSTANEGEDCSSGGPYCTAGLICRLDPDAPTGGGGADAGADAGSSDQMGTCSKYCCSDTDCDAAAGEVCIVFKATDADGYEFVTGDQLGVCVATKK
jgi:hypothetical protein